ncbi:MAG: hypothetical protein AB1765_11470, partial [Candidatus Hydrogenedentota bacterium]
VFQRSHHAVRCTATQSLKNQIQTFSCLLLLASFVIFLSVILLLASCLLLLLDIIIVTTFFRGGSYFNERQGCVSVFRWT